MSIPVQGGLGSRPSRHPYNVLARALLLGNSEIYLDLPIVPNFDEIHWIMYGGWWLSPKAGWVLNGVDVAIGIPLPVNNRSGRTYWTAWHHCVFCTRLTWNTLES